MTILEAVQFLHDRNILSAPVLDVTKEDSDTWKDKYVGVLDMIKRECLPALGLLWLLASLANGWGFQCACTCWTLWSFGQRSPKRTRSMRTSRVP
jgi:hypothetical protein